MVARELQGALIDIEADDPRAFRCGAPGEMSGSAADVQQRVTRAKLERRAQQRPFNVADPAPARRVVSAAAKEWACGEAAWRRINLVGLNRRDGGCYGYCKWRSCGVNSLAWNGRAFGHAERAVGVWGRQLFEWLSGRRERTGAMCRERGERRREDCHRAHRCAAPWQSHE
ncbi:MAG: hypothetical protein AMXMBFR6_00770 [Betaproteobacteria bacterium]